MPTHVDLRYREIQKLMPHVQKYQKLAEAYGIRDIFQDAGGKMLQLLVAIGLDHSPGRMGPDAIDRMGNQYEIKTVDISRGRNGFSTNHHVKHATIKKYRERKWVFAVYDRIQLLEAYLVQPKDLEKYFRTWEDTLNLGVRTHINNPKIPINTIVAVGEPAYIKDKPAKWMVDLIKKDNR